MSASTLNQQGPFGLFELDPAGTVLYSRIETDGDAEWTASDIDGRNFFEEVVAFENAEEIRRRINFFARGEGQADGFHFTCRCDGGPRPVKVLLARIRERTDGKRTKSILVHIRKV